MQSGPSLFCLSLRRLAILLTRARSHLVVTLSIFLWCDSKWGRQKKSVFLWAYQRSGVGERIGREITAGIVQVRAAWVSAGPQAPFVQCLVVFSTPWDLMWIYESEESTRRGICMAMDLSTYGARKNGARKRGCSADSDPSSGLTTGLQYTLGMCISQFFHGHIFSVCSIFIQFRTHRCRHCSHYRQKQKQSVFRGTYSNYFKNF